MPNPGLTINCYQCKSSETIECSDVMINMPDAKLKPESCDHVFEAEYCIKSTSLESKISLQSIRIFCFLARFLMNCIFFLLKVFLTFKFDKMNFN